MMHTRVHLLWRDRSVSRKFKTGVSLHSHTMHSRESLTFIPIYAQHIPLLAWELNRLAKSYQARYGRPLDYSRGHWTPPLPAREAYELERQAVEEQLNLAALVSISDHDNIEAGFGLREIPETSEAPISVEWTVPIDGTYFHLGLHNLPPESARSIAAEAARYTHQPEDGLRKEILAAVSRNKGTLVVLNHPFWDQGHCGNEHHNALLSQLLDESGDTIHALELNGLRPWRENRKVINLAREDGRPLISGGDRHTCEPSTIYNLTQAAGFAEFAEEVRAGYSVVVIHDRYKEPRSLRIVKALSEIMGEHPALAERSRWTDRVFCKRYTGATCPVSEIWNGNTPGVVRLFDRSLALARKRPVQRFLRLCFGRGVEIELEAPVPPAASPHQCVSEPSGRK